jgi:Tol biopolymer transport system component
MARFRSSEFATGVALVVVLGGSLSANGPERDARSTIALTVPQSLTTSALPHSPTVALSGDGRVLAFESERRLLAADRNNCGDVYVLDLATKRLSLASQAWDGGSGNGSSFHPALSADGRFVVFTSDATNLEEAPGAGIGSNVYLRDLEQQETGRISRAIDGGPANASSDNPAISADATTIAFESGATNLTAGPDANREVVDIYAFHRGSGQTDRVSVASSGLQGAAVSFGPAINGNGSRIAFASRADLGCPRAAERGAAPAPLASVYVRDTRTHLTLCVSAASAGRPANGASYHAAIDATGTRVAFASEATNLGVHDANGAADVYLRDLETGATTLVSRTPRGKAGNGRSWRPAISGDGRTVAFTTTASDLATSEGCRTSEPDLNLVADVYVLRLESGAATRISTGPCGDVWWEASYGAAIDARGAAVAFSSRHATGPEDTRFDDDAYLSLITSH